MLRLSVIVIVLTLLAVTVASAQQPSSTPTNWELSALQASDLTSRGGLVSYEVTKLGDSGRSLWADVGALWYPGPKINGAIGLSANVPWFGSTLQDNTRWCAGLEVPLQQGNWGLYLGIRVKTFEW